MRGKLSGDNGEEEIEEEDITGVSVDYPAKRMEVLERASKLFEELSPLYEARYSPETLTKEKEDIRKEKTRRGLSTMGELGAAVLAAPGHMGALQALGHGATQAGTFRRLEDIGSEARTETKALAQREIKGKEKIAGLQLKQLSLESKILEAGEAGQTAKLNALTKERDALLKKEKHQLNINKYNVDVANFLASKDWQDLLASGKLDEIEIALSRVTNEYGLSDAQAKQIRKEAGQAVKEQGVLTGRTPGGGRVGKNLKAWE